MENLNSENLEERIAIPVGQFSNPIEDGMGRKELLKNVCAFLTIPERVQVENRDIELPKALGVFLIEQNYIRNISLLEESWTFKYDSENKNIYIAQEEMPEKIWRDFIFRKQTLLENGSSEPLGPKHSIYNYNGNKDELDIYCFLHETSHAYQEYLKDKESLERNLNPRYYYENAVNKKIRTPFSELFSFCYNKRKEIHNKYNIVRGLSTWGRVENYKYGKNDEIPNQNSEHAARALEDSNELLTMYLWHPKYFDSYINHLSNSPKNEIYKKGLARIDEKESEFLKDIIHLLIEEMKAKSASH